MEVREDALRFLCVFLGMWVQVHLEDRRGYQSPWIWNYRSCGQPGLGAGIQTLILMTEQQVLLTSESGLCQSLSLP